MKSESRECSFMLTCVRHGETEANEIGLVQGQGVDSPLNDTGKLQSKKIGWALAKEKYDFIYCSDLKRTRQTAEIIVSENKYQSAELIFDEKLRERCFGVMEGHYFHELRNVGFPSDDLEEELNLPEGAESLKDVEKRALEFFEGLCSRVRHLNNPNAVNVLVISHGGYLACLFNRFYKDYDCSFPRGVHPGEISVNTCRSKFEIALKNKNCATGNASTSKPKVKIVCKCFNDRSHLHRR